MTIKNKNNRAFSFGEYSQILKALKGRLNKFNPSMPDEFVIIRHDVEFNINRALEVAVLESKVNVSSTFFFQVISSAYNPFSIKNLKKIKKIKDLGHDVGLHFYVTHLSSQDIKELSSELLKQKQLFEIGLNLPCHAFSFHRPPKWVLEIRENIIEGMLNAYGPEFFEFSSNPTKIKYIADSKHEWAYGHPLECLDYQRLQILMHPDEWSTAGDSGNKDFFSNLINENRFDFISTLDEETKHFSDYKDKFK